MSLLKTNQKGRKGQLATIMNLIIAVFVVGAIGVFVFELTRYLLAHDELKTNVEVAALCCQTTLASSGDPTSSTNQQAAETAGLALFRQNSILGQVMTNATLVSEPTALEPAPGNAQICFQFLDPLTRVPVNSSGSGVSAGVTSPSTAGTLIEAIGAYCYAPAFGSFIGLSGANFTIQSTALSGVPKIDLMLVLDISGGMDDNTSVSFFQRWEGNNGTNWMIIPNPIWGYTAQGQLYTTWCVEQTGHNPPVGVNALPPHELEKLDNSGCVTIYYSEGSYGGTSKGLAGAGIGTPPGNACQTSGSSPTTSTSYNKPPEKTPIAQRKPDTDLLEICQKVAGKKIAPASMGKESLAQLDGKFSKVCFKPYITINASTSSSSSTTTGTTTTSVVYTTTDPSSDPPIPGTYTSSDNMQYVPYSYAPGGQSSTPANQVLPSIAGVGCSGGSTSLVFGSPAPKVFTGLVCNGVVGAINPANPNMKFTNLGTAIEALLGNLESNQYSTQSGIDTGDLSITPMSGWFAFYYLAARSFLQPMMANLNALVGFINEMSIISDIHYGLITFNDTVGSSPSSTVNVNNVSADYNYFGFDPLGNMGVSSNYPVPNIALSSSNSNQSTIINTLPTLSVYGGRNVSNALQTALSQLQSNGRAGANQAIILITSGPPNGSDSPSAAIAKAQTIGQSGIPVFVVCTSLASTYDAANDAAYSDSGGSGGGVAAASGHGAKYYRVDYNNPTNTQNSLVTVFANIARRLVSIVQSSS